MITLVIRSYQEAQKTLELLQKCRIRGHVQPTLDIKPLPYDTASIDLPFVQAIVVTSQNALHYLQNHTFFQPFPLYCVGQATAELAKSLGYKYVHSADGNNEDLLTLIQQSCSPQAGTVLHITCPQVPMPFIDQLKQAGYQAESLMVYNALLMNDLKEDTKSNLQKGVYDNVLFFSPRSAKHFVYLCQQSGLGNQLSSLSAFCLSPAIAQTITQIHWQKLLTAPKPKLSALVDLLCHQKKENL